MNLKGFLTKETAGLPNWAWAGVVVVGVGAGLLIPILRGKSSASSGQNGGKSGAGQSGPGGAPVMSPYSQDDMQEGGSGVDASTTNLSLPYPGLPADNMALVGLDYMNPNVGQGLLASEFGLGEQYPWFHDKFYDSRKQNRDRRDPKRLKGRTEYQGQSGRGMDTRGGDGDIGNVQASRVGSR